MAEENKRVEKEWGVEVYYTNTPYFCAKELHVECMKICSLHKHYKKHEMFRVLKGHGFIQVESRIYMVKPGDHLHIPAGTLHRFWTLWHEGMVLLEISNYHDDEDVERVVPSDKIYTAESDRQYEEILVGETLKHEWYNSTKAKEIADKAYG